mmetsp:Transcript_6114/g.12461  ORF Transcript_6114/g.12461 Transcript_6114/m.12461 type:complete len:93 (-) Transcript_6114:803-1081(-)
MFLVSSNMLIIIKTKFSKDKIIKDGVSPRKQQQQQQQRELCMSSGAEPFVESSKSVLRLHQGGREGGMGTSSRSPSSQETVAGLRLRARTLA